MSAEKMTVTFRDFDNPLVDGSTRHLSGFTVEPPIRVHDSGTLEHIALFLGGGPEGETHALGRILVTHSTEVASYGHFWINSVFPSLVNPEEVANFKDLLKSIFDAALNPTGQNEIDYVFLGDTPEQP